MSRRELDMKAEQELAKFMDEYLYDILKNQNVIKSYKRTGKDMQLKGVDVIIDDIIYIDEKAVLYYINKNIPTFAFELDFFNRAERKSIGWLLNEELLTQYYLLIWPNATITDLKKITKDSFTELDCMLISKKKLRNYLDGKGFSMEKLVQRSNTIRTGDINGRISAGFDKEFYFYLSNESKYAEKPLNIVIYKKILQRLSSAHYVVKKDKLLRKCRIPT